jgi:hypothetical protein
MANPDITTKALVKKPEFFADIFNTFVFGGRQVINHSDLIPVDTTMSVVMEKHLEAIMPIDKLDDAEKEIFLDCLEKMYGKPEDDKSSDFPFWVIAYSRTRDALMMGKEGESRYCIWGIENQTTIDTTMLLRMMLYDVLGLYLDAKGNFNYGPNDERTGKRLTSQRKLTPICSVVLYWGDEDWEGEHHLEEFLDPDGLRLLGGEYNLSYTMKVINARKMYEKIDDMHDNDLKAISTYLNNEEKGKELYPVVSEAVAAVYGSITHQAIDGKGKDEVNMEGGLINGAEIKKKDDELIRLCISQFTSLARKEGVSISDTIINSDTSDAIKQDLLDYVKAHNL